MAVSRTIRAALVIGTLFASTAALSQNNALAVLEQAAALQASRARPPSVTGSRLSGAGSAADIELTAVLDSYLKNAFQGSGARAGNLALSAESLRTSVGNDPAQISAAIDRIKKSVEIRMREAYSTAAALPSYASVAEFRAAITDAERLVISADNKILEATQGMTLADVTPKFTELLASVSKKRAELQLLMEARTRRLGIEDYMGIVESSGNAAAEIPTALQKIRTDGQFNIHAKDDANLVLMDFMQSGTLAAPDATKLIASLKSRYKDSLGEAFTENKWNAYLRDCLGLAR